MDYKILTASEKRIKEILNCLDELVSMQGNPTQAALFAYIAGIIDGEGTIRISKSKVRAHWNYSYYAMVSCGMVTKEIPELLSSTLGGSFREERVAGKRSIWRWNLTGRFQVYAALKILKPYLIVKKRQAELVLEFCENWKNPVRHHHIWVIDTKQLQWREESYLKMREFNAVGAGATTKRVGMREHEAIV